MFAAVKPVVAALVIAFIAILGYQAANVLRTASSINSEATAIIAAARAEAAR